MRENDINCDCNIIHEEKVKETKAKMLDNKLFLEATNFFKIMSDQTRLKILFALDNNEMCVCDIANTLDMTKSSISHQLSLLREQGIIKFRKEGKIVYYTLDDEHIKEVFEIAFKHIQHKRGIENEQI